MNSTDGDDTGGWALPLSATDLTAFSTSLLGRELRPEGLHSLLAQGCLRYVEWAPDQAAAHRGEHQGEFFVVLAGQLEVTRSRTDGARHIIDTVTPGIACGAVTAFGENARWPADVRAINAVHALAVVTSTLLCAAPIDPWRQVLLQGCVRLLAERARHLNALGELLSRRGLRARLAFFLVHHSDERSWVDLVLTRQELADTLQVSRASMTRELGRMADEGLIAVHHRAFEILDRSALHRIAQ